MKSLKIISIILLLVGTFAILSCSSNRKCNGSKGVKTPMGKM